MNVLKIAHLVNPLESGPHLVNRDDKAKKKNQMFQQVNSVAKLKATKNCHLALKHMGLGSGIRKKPIPDPGVKKAPDPGSATLEITRFDGTIMSKICDSQKEIQRNEKSSLTS
jgi:hypothetical protein